PAAQQVFTPMQIIHAPPARRSPGEPLGKSSRQALSRPLARKLKGHASGSFDSASLRSGPARITNSALCFRQVCLVNFEPNKLFHAAIFCSDRAVSDAEKRIEHGLHTRNAMKLCAPFR